MTAFTRLHITELALIVCLAPLQNDSFNDADQSANQPNNLAVQKV